MLVGREAEQERLGLLLRQASAGHGASLVVRGEAGIGKTALLERVVETAGGFRVLRALGVESEAELPFAGLDELLRPVLSFVDDLPVPQSDALKGALALLPAAGVDRFATYAATLTLLSTVSSERPLLCVVDDAHWLDHASAEALTFAARRLSNESILLLFASREPEPGLSLPGIAELRLDPLTPVDARTLIATSAPSLHLDATARVVDAAHGNPLALVEFAAAAERVEPSDSLAEPLPVGERVERAFLERVSSLSADARRALLLTAAAEPSESDAVWQALTALGVPIEAISDARRRGLLVAGGRLDFCHPLARSSVYHGAAPSERRAVHAALAEATGNAERRAWHLAAAAAGADEQVARAVERTAVAAGQRGGVAAKARALERAARLTPDVERRAQRLFAAALAAEAAGRLEAAERLLEETSESAEDVILRADAVARRSYLLFDRGEFDRALTLALEEAGRAPPPIAARLVTASGVVHAQVHRLEIAQALDLTMRALRLAGPAGEDDLDLCHMRAWTYELSAETSEALRIARPCADRVLPGTVVAIDIGAHLLYGEDYEAARELFDRIVAHERDLAATGNLAYALDLLSRLELRLGRLTPAYAASLESVRLTEPLGNDIALGAALAWLGLVEGMVGRSADARAHGMRAVGITELRDDRWNAVRARGALGHEALVRGRAAEAAGWLQPAARMLAEGGVRHPNMFRLDGDLIEAYARDGRTQEANAQLTRLIGDARATGQRWPAVVAARCTAMLAEDADTEDAFEAALVLHESEASPFEAARTRLCFGERLRRLRRRRQAREQLHEALTTFDRIGARPWSERTRTELRASGERLQPRGPTAHERLTPQELQAALAAADGLTNKEIAARLFLSPKTVEFHLSRAYRKLGVRSRSELARLLISENAAIERLLA